MSGTVVLGPGAVTGDSINVGEDKKLQAAVRIGSDGTGVIISAMARNYRVLKVTAKLISGAPVNITLNANGVPLADFSNQALSSGILEVPSQAILFAGDSLSITATGTTAPTNITLSLDVQPE